MTILILEDEQRAAERLQKMVAKAYPQAELPQPIDSVEEAVNWLEQHPQPEVILMDIELADGRSFEIFRQREVKSKVIFCTAFDQYAVEAFKHQGVAYLLKPIKQEELEGALQRALAETGSGIDYDRLAEAVERRQSRHQKRILVKLGHRYKAIPVEEIAYAFTESKTVMVMTTAGKEVPVDQNLEQLEEILDPSKFFRINRQIIVSIDAIDNMYAWSRSRLKLELNPPREDMEAVVATERAANFKQWLEGKDHLR